jgi:sigma-54 dependent transcriptional regulator, acetoin dehydrogenase operon transcriptional activator AcoR
VQNLILPPAGLGRSMSGTVKRSWDRARRRGLCASDTLMFNEVSVSLQRQVRERNKYFTDAVAPELAALSQSLAPSGWIVACVDDMGIVVDALGKPSDDDRRLKLALRTGVSLSEDAVGTNAPGCALVERRPVIIGGCDHYLQEAHQFLCVAVPISDPRGRLLGALDASCEHGGNPLAVMESLVLAGRATENRLVLALNRAIFIRFHHRLDMIGTPLEGILAFSEDGELLGMNQTARHIFSIDGGGQRTITFESLFGSGFQRTVERLRANRGGMLLESAHGMLLHSRLGTSADVARVSPQWAGTPRRIERDGAPAMVARDARVGQMLDKAARAFARDIPVLVNGETGTGKEVVARLLHHQGPRANGPFVAINCSSIPPSLIESELFGYVDGAFTGGRRGGAAGRLEQANGGTLFLDEIGDMPLELQTRLLRVLQERSISRIGGSELISIDISLVCATHRDLRQLLADGRFREDLFYRINGLRIELPPLRERCDLDELIEQFLARESAAGVVPRLSEAALAALHGYRWPGNIRQLQHVLHLAAVLAEGEPCITPEHLPAEVVVSSSGETSRQAARAPHGLPSLRQSEAELIRIAMHATGGNISEVARRIGVSRQTLYRKLKKYGQ